MLLLNDKIVNKIILMKGKIGKKKVNQNSRTHFILNLPM